MTTDERLKELTQQVANHLAGRKVKIRWENPPSKSAAGQTTKSISGDLTVWIGNLESADARFRTYLHEISHCRADFDFIPATATRASGSANRSMTERKVWKKHPREQRAKDQAAHWILFAERNCFKYWRVDRSLMECKLLALLDWKESK